MQENCITSLTSNQTFANVLEPIGNVIISLIRHVENARETDVCLGASTRMGYLTSLTCCQADEIFVLDFDDASEISIEANSYWKEEKICLINTTEIFEYDFPISDRIDQQLCSIVTFDFNTSQLNEFQLEMKVLSCLQKPCLQKMFPESLENQIIFNGTSIQCHQSYLGIVTKSKFLGKVVLCSPALTKIIFSCLF